MGLFSKPSKAQPIIPAYNPRASCYKMNTLHEIETIPVPKRKFEYNCDFTESIEYVLQRKATQYKKEGKMDLAIACLRKSNEIMPFAPMTYSEKDYGRLEQYLKLAGKFDEAATASSKTEQVLSLQEREFVSKQLQLSNFSDMIEVPREIRICSECAKYHDRIYSKNGIRGFPNMLLFLNYLNQKQCNCSLLFHPYWFGMSAPTISGKQHLLQYSTRPFEDNRLPDEKRIYDEYIAEIQREKKDRQDYDWICEYLPDIAPKSFGGYRNMKNKNSTNYQKLVLLAEENGYTI